MELAVVEREDEARAVHAEPRPPRDEEGAVAALLEDRHAVEEAGGIFWHALGAESVTVNRATTLGPSLADPASCDHGENRSNADQ